MLPIYVNHNTMRQIYTSYQQYQTIICTRKCPHNPPPVTSITLIIKPQNHFRALIL